MSESYESSDEESSRLDESFKRALAEIRPYVLSLTSAESAKLCGMWLSKINCITTQRHLRNEYIVELCRQLKRGRLEGKFTERPPNGPLQPLSTMYQMTKNVTSPGNESFGSSKTKQNLLGKRRSCETGVDDRKIANVPDLDTIVEQLQEEITSLKAKLFETKRAKSILEENHRAFVRQSKSTIAEQVQQLKTQLEKTKGENEALAEEVIQLSEKLKDVRAERKMIENEIAEKYSKDNEPRGNGIMTDQKEKDLLEAELRTVLNEQYKSMKEEFMKMKSDVDLFAKNQSQRFFHKIDSLKKTICKLEKAKQKLICDYEKKIFRITQSKELEIKALELRLYGQTGELSVSSNLEKQCEVDNLMDTLEEKYRAILTAADVTAENQRQTYLKKITLLEEQLNHLKKSFAGDGE